LYNKHLQPIKAKDTVELNGGIPAETIVDICVEGGHWSIWMTVFAGIREIRVALIAAFPGTRQAMCFDSNGDSVPRPGGQI
jgi:hypothetical protein